MIPATCPKAYITSKRVFYANDLPSKRKLPAFSFAFDYEEIILQVWPARKLIQQVTLQSYPRWRRPYLIILFDLLSCTKTKIWNQLIMQWCRLRGNDFSWVTEASPIVSQTCFFLLGIIRIYLFVLTPGRLKYGKYSFHNLHSGSLNVGLGLSKAIWCFIFWSQSGALKRSGVSDTAGSRLLSIVGGLGHVQ